MRDGVSCPSSIYSLTFENHLCAGRFLQSPGGQTQQGTPRKYTDGNAAVRVYSHSLTELIRAHAVPSCGTQWHMRTHIQAGKESQSSLINYTKAGRPFINLVTMCVRALRDPPRDAS